jgi:hypothetical protein
MSSTTCICSSDACIVLTVARTASTTAFPRSVRGNACFLVGDMRRLSRVPQLLSRLSDCFERLAIMISDLTHFLRESPVTSVRWRAARAPDVAPRQSRS